MPYADREAAREYQRGRSSPDTLFDRSTGYADAERRRPPCAEICNDIRRRFATKGWHGLSTPAFRERILEESLSCRSV